MKVEPVLKMKTQTHTQHEQTENEKYSNAGNKWLDCIVIK